MNASCEETFDLRNKANLARFLYVPSEKILYTIVWPCIIFIGLVSNILFIWTVKRVSSLHTSTYVFLASLAFADIGTLISIGTNIITDVAKNPIRFGDISIVTITTSTISFFSITCSFFFVSLASLERYLSVCHPVRHHLLKGFKRTLKSVFIALIIGSSLSLASVVYVLDFTTACVFWPEDLKFLHYPNTFHLSFLNQFSRSTGVKIGDILIVCFVVLVTISNCFFYIRILQELSKRKRSTVLQTSAQLERTIHQASVMVVVNGLVFLVCYLTFAVRAVNDLTSSVFQIDLIDDEYFIIFQASTNSLFILNASVNPIIYLIVNQRYRHAFMTTLRIGIGGSCC